MNRRQKMRESLPPAGETCTLCNAFLSADKILSLDSQRCHCLHCGGDYIVRVHPKWSQCAR
jgi:hypothetical protein